MKFLIEKPSFDPIEGKAVFPFKIADQCFVETLIFPSGFNVEISHTDPFQSLLNLTACTLGTSYFKLLAPLDIHLPDFSLTKLQKNLVQDLYENGLGEFYATNNLSRFGKLNFQVQITQPSKLSQTSSDIDIADARSLLLIGGGKDSNVSALLLAQNNLNFTPFAVNPKGPILPSIEAMQKSPLFVQRQLDKNMITLSKQAGYYNGHVPSTAINSMIAALSAWLYGYQNIILSNERSASEGNIVFDGRTVNHQHSKSHGFEKLLAQTLVQTTNNKIKYFSLLRPYSELKIAKIFSQSKIFDHSFSSCNTNFKQGNNTAIHWCNACPKCHFVYLMFAPFMPKTRLDAIFGTNPLATSQNISSFKNLVGLGNQKPWECVGETIEAAAALFSLHKISQFAQSPIMQSLKPQLLKTYGEKKLIAAFSELLKDSNDHDVPPQFLSNPQPALRKI